MADRPSVIERLVRNMLRLERLANTVATESQQRMQDLFEQIATDLRDLDPTSPPQTTYRRLRVEKFLDRLRERLSDFAPEQERFLKDRLAVIGREQALFAEESLVATLGQEAADRVSRTPITQQRLRAIMNAEPFRGRLLKEHTERLSANALTRVRDQVRLGMANEEAIGDIVRRVRGRQAGFIRKDPDTGRFVPKGTPGAEVRPRFVGGALSTSTREAEALVRTAVNFISNEGMVGTYRENARLLQGVEFVATLDANTTTICLRWDGTVWPVDSDELQQPPLHYNCRSTLVPVVDWDRLGMDAPPDQNRSARSFKDVSAEEIAKSTSGNRAGDVVQIPSSVKAEAWLKDQPVRVQEELLGVRKAKLFRKGEISLKDLVRRDNTTVPLSELE